MLIPQISIVLVPWLPIKVVHRSRRAKSNDEHLSCSASLAVPDSSGSADAYSSWSLASLTSSPAGACTSSCCGSWFSRSCYHDFPRRWNRLLLLQMVVVPSGIPLRGLLSHMPWIQLVRMVLRQKCLIQSSSLLSLRPELSLRRDLGRLPRLH